MMDSFERVCLGRDPDGDEQTALRRHTGWVEPAPLTSRSVSKTERSRRAVRTTTPSLVLRRGSSSSSDRVTLAAMKLGHVNWPLLRSS